MTVLEPQTMIEAMTLPEAFGGAEKLATGAGWPFDLFALIEREDTPGTFDLVVSARWTHPDRAGIAHIIKVLSAGGRLTVIDWMLISRIVPLDPLDEFVRVVARLYPTEHGLREVPAGTLGGTRINRAVIITARAPGETEAEAGAGAVSEAVAAAGDGRRFLLGRGPKR